MPDGPLPGGGPPLPPSQPPARPAGLFKNMIDSLKFWWGTRRWRG